MNRIQSLRYLVNRGRKGLNKGLSMGLPRLEAIMDGIQRQTYTIITGGTGSGKTTLALYSYVYRLIMDHLGDPKYRVVYFSLEMTAEILLAKLMCLHIYETYGVELTYKDIMSRQDILSDEMYELVESCYPWLEQFSEHLEIHDKGTTANGIYNILHRYAEANGTFIENEQSKTYTPTIENELVMVVVDHLGLLNLMQGQNKKEAMDLASKFLMRFRNLCAYSPLVLLQLNRTQSSMARRDKGLQEIELSDIKDTGGPSEDAEVILAIYHPWREKVSNYKNWNIKILQDKFRAIQILKSRLGEADKSIPINFFGSIGYWKELPKYDERPSDLEYDQFLHLIPIIKAKVEPEDKPVMRFRL